MWAPSNAFNAFVYPSIALMNPNEEACAQDLSAFVGPAQGSEEEMGLGPGAFFDRQEEELQMLTTEGELPKRILATEDAPSNRNYQQARGCSQRGFVTC